jgi:hypothetical protein
MMNRRTYETGWRRCADVEPSNEWNRVALGCPSCAFAFLLSMQILESEKNPARHMEYKALQSLN